MNHTISTKKIETNCCEYCGKTFEKVAIAGRKKKYCDRKCGDRAKAERYKNKFTLICKNCNCEFGSPNSLASFCSISCQSTFNHKNNNNTKVDKRCFCCGKQFEGEFFSKYCSDECKYETKKCPQCNQEFKVERGNAYKKTFCSNACRNRNDTKHLSICENCNCEFTGKLNRLNKFCSRKCFYEKLGYEEHGTKCTNHLSDVSSIRRAIQYGVYYEKIDVLRVFEDSSWTCGICNEEVNKNAIYPNPKSASLDHIIPLSKGGTHTRDNVQCAHLKCNIRKNNNLDKAAQSSGFFHD